MAHKKEIYTTVFKSLPSTNLFIKKETKVEDLNRLSAAFYYLFNSDTLTRRDYIHIFNVLREKLPIYEQSGDMEKMKALAVAYAEYNYPPNPDIRRVISDFLDHAEEIPPFALGNALGLISTKLGNCSEFVGVELHARGFSLTPISEQTLATIKGIILVGK